VQIVKGPVTRYLPADAYRIGFSHKAPEVKNIFEFVQHECPEDRVIVFVVGCFAHGKVEAAWVDTEISISSYPLSAAQAIGRITHACEQRWQIV
jgi:rRNA small subunit pseudouridine methyltransferase Nep1